jgi:hypothetical protein
VTLALDDFGTGYSAITALHRLPIHTLKIDRSFVADVVAEPATAALVQGLLQLGAGMGLQVIAEGIEDGEQARWLREHGCAMAQGYAFGRPAPLPARELDELTVSTDVVEEPALPPLTGPDLHDPSEDEWGPEADTGPRFGSAVVPQLDAFVLPGTGVLPVQDEPAVEFDPGVFRPSQAVAELRALLAANGALDPSVLPEPREPAEAGLRALAADPGDLSGLRPWLESFQQQLGPSTTGELPEVRDRS